MLALWLVSSAMAFDVLSTAALPDHFKEIENRVGEPPVVAAAGNDAWRTLQQLLRTSPPPSWTVERVPLMGEVDRDMARVLAETGRPCALRVSGGGTPGEWFVSEHGACGAPNYRLDRGWVPEDGAVGVASGTPAGVADGDGDEAASVLAPMLGSPQVGGIPLEGRLLLLDHTVPDPTTALLSSALVGFGAGHFYAHDMDAGWLHLGLQAGGLGLWGLSALIKPAAWNPSGQTAAKAIGVLGLGITVGSRLWDAGTAPRAAEIEARRQIELQLR